MSTEAVPVFWHYAKTQPPPVTYARTLAEMGYAVSLQSCPSCGERETPRLTMMGSADRWTYVCDCTRCGARRSHVFATHGDPGAAPRPRFQLGVGASEIITPKQFASEGAREHEREYPARQSAVRCRRRIERRVRKLVRELGGALPS